ncbi:hypothetical protein [Flaviaesturariibacter amylovorans]|uniref:Four-helix bundle copper-binding protein n=1 Tax=Flaviaesturariibacter amylovorans TaxID=1084520 RepID=A0ABP8H458_9BACT
MLHFSTYLGPCVSAWSECMQLRRLLDGAPVTYSTRTLQVLDECATLCLGTLQALQCGFAQVPALALLCVGVCAECAECCARYGEAAFAACADACTRCAAALSDLAAEGAAQLPG